MFYITGTLGVVLAAVIFFGVREPQRGGSEPEMAGVEQVTTYRFSWPAAKALFRKRSLRLLFVQGFFGVFPWNVITFWFFTYLEKERGYTGTTLFVTMAAAVLVLAAGYPLGGALGDALFQRTPRGRVIVATIGVLIGAVLLTITLAVPTANQGLFLVMLALTALFIPFAAPNVISTVYDVTLPEVRSTALSDPVLHRVGRRGAGAADRRAHRRPLVAAGRDPADLRLDLDPVRDLLRLRRPRGARRHRRPARADARAGRAREGAANRGRISRRRG